MRRLVVWTGFGEETRLRVSILLLQFTQSIDRDTGLTSF